MGKDDIERILDSLIKEAEENPDWKAINALKCAKKELLKEDKPIIVHAPKGILQMRGLSD